MTDRALLDKLRSKAFTPGAKDAKALLSMLGALEREDAREVVRSLSKMGRSAIAPALSAAAASSGVARARALEVAGRVAGAEDAAAREALVAALSDEHERVVKVAARALGRMGAVGAIPQDDKQRVERALVEARARATKDDLEATLIEALGKVGGGASLEAISAQGGAAARAAQKAKLLLTREAAREGESAIDPEGRLQSAGDVRFHCREGLEAIVLEELGDAFRGKRAAPGVVDAMLEASLGAVFRSRTWTRVGFPIVDRALREGEDKATAIAKELTGARAKAIFEAFTRGPVRFRLAWSEGGHRRKLVFDVASRVAERDASLVNDPTSSTWEAEVDDRRGRLAIELTPKALDDPRFAFRVADVPAASHPTIAAAIVHLGGVAEGDVVWDPFCGSGMELVLRAKAGPYASLLGTDTSEAALVAAEQNLTSAGVDRYRLEKSSALDARPRDLTLVVTNPPMGRRITGGAPLDELLVPMVSHVARGLVRGGRLAWVTPSPKKTDPAAQRGGLVLDRAITIDMGGFPASLQRWTKR